MGTGRTYVTLPRPGRTNPDCPATYHGSEAAYKRGGCRCPEAREAWRLRSKRRREHRDTPRLVDVTGTARRLRALAAIGWSWQALAEHAPVGRRRLSNLAARQEQRVHVSSAAMVADLYARQSSTPAPASRGATWARNTAVRNGWMPPAAWDDETIDDPNVMPNPGGDGRDIVDEVAIRRVIDGHARYGGLRLAERRELVRTYAPRIPNLSSRIGMSGAQFNRWVAEFEAQPADA